MRKIKKNKKRSKKSGGILFTVSFACLIALVGLVHVLIAQQIEVLLKTQNNNTELISELSKEKDIEIEENDNFFSNENILNLLKKYKNFDESLALRPPNDTIYIKGVN